MADHTVSFDPWWGRHCSPGGDLPYDECETSTFHVKQRAAVHLKHRYTDGPLPTSRFDLVDDAGEVLGFCQLRHRAACGSYLPAEAASNVYYQIEAEYRGRGYGKVLMGLALAEAKRIGLDKVRLTVDDDNPVSRHIIEWHGATWLRDFVDAEGVRCHLYEVATDAGP